MLTRACTRRARLLYVAPERLMLDGLPQRLRAARRTTGRSLRRRRGPLHQPVGPRLPPRVRAARPSCRGRFPDVPLIAFTATATTDVRDDIVDRARPRDGALYVGRRSTGRTSYSRRAASGRRSHQRPATSCAAHSGEAGIVYCTTRKRDGRPGRDACRADGHQGRGPTTRACERPERATRTRTPSSATRCT